MEQLTLIRGETSDNGTFGILYRIIDDKLTRIAVTCELPWKDNQPMKSCIPQSSYVCTPHDGTKFHNVWELVGVPNRQAILIHNGNTIKDTDGCILVGSDFGVVGGKPAVINSVQTLQMLRENLPDEFELVVSGVI
jgi:hypothetical protein